MSEALPGLDFDLPPAQPRDAAAVVLVHAGEGPDRPLYWARRQAGMRFAAGYHSFPGGAVDESDFTTPVQRCEPDDAPLVACAVRELFEETGVLLAAGAEALDPGRRAALRTELLEGAPFPELLARDGLRIDAEALAAAGRFLTPTSSRIRYDTRFFLAVVPPGTEVAMLRDGELDAGEWIRPSEALARWEEGAALLYPPPHHVLSVLAEVAAEDAGPRLLRPPYLDAEHVPDRNEYQRGILTVQLRTPTLLPATHTACHVLGTGELALVDPGSPWEDEQDKLEQVIRERMRDGCTPRCVLLTHHHGDHTGAALAIADRLSIPVWASPTTARLVGDVVEGCLEDGDVIELAGPRPMRFRAVLTEGHADGHLCFWDEVSHAVIAGDMVSALSTIVIAPPEGKMGLYLASLRKLADLPTRTLYPAHGTAIPDGPGKLAEYLEHREMRIRRVHEALVEGLEEIEAIVERVYDDTPPFLHPVAQLSALASLIELEDRGRAVRADDSRWRPA